MSPPRSRKGWRVGFLWPTIGSKAMRFVSVFDARSAASRRHHSAELSGATSDIKSIAKEDRHYRSQGFAGSGKWLLSPAGDMSIQLHCIQLARGSGAAGTTLR